MTDAELIREVATKIMGWHRDPDTWDVENFNPLTDMNHTLMVVDKLREKGWRVRIHNTLFRPPDELWRVWFVREIDEYWTEGRAYPNLGHAICLAALAALKTEGI